MIDCLSFICLFECEQGIHEKRYFYIVGKFSTNVVEAHGLGNFLEIYLKNILCTVGIC